MNTPPNPNDELFEAELRIAKRADELVLKSGFSSEHALESWRQAEREFWQDRNVPSPEPSLSACT